MIKVVFFVQRIGPYHKARFKEASKVLYKNNAKFHVIEICSMDHIYKWDKLLDDYSFKRETLFDKRYDKIGFLELFQRIMKILNAINPQILYISGWSSKEALFSLFWAKTHKKKCITISESSEIDSKRTYFKEIIKKSLIKMFHAGFVGGISHKEYLIELGLHKNKIFKGYNAVDNLYFKPKSSLTYNGDGYILASGRFIGRKNFVRLLIAYKDYRRLVTNPKKLVLCGSGVLDKTIKQTIENFELKEFIKTPGFVQYEELPKLYHNASVYVIPSLSEQWGLVVNEAMASGIPVLASEVCGSAIELIKDGFNGYKFNPYETESITSSLVMFDKLMDSDKKVLSINAQLTISKYGVEKFANGVLLSTKSVMV